MPPPGVSCTCPWKFFCAAFGFPHFHFSAPFLCAYKNPANNIKKKMMISIKAIHPTLLATTAQGKMNISSTRQILKQDQGE